MPDITNDIKLDYKDVLLCPKKSTLRSRAEVDLFVEMTFRNSKRTFKGIPIMASNMDSVGTFEMARALSKHGLFTVIKKYYGIEEWKSFAVENPKILDYIAVSSGTGHKDLERLSCILKAIPELSFIFLFVANGYSQHFVECVKNVRSAFPNHTIMDGGCTCVGDFAKAFGAGADFIMAGGMFAGHDQGGGEIVEKDGKRYCQFYGMCSATAMKKHYGGVAQYRAAEGKTVEIPYKGDVEGTVLDMLGGLRSTCTYVGASRLQELPQRTTFVRCTQVINSIYGP